jgi:uncharacterized membrane protein YphA (DoxX/SURF4 family)
MLAVKFFLALVLGTSCLHKWTARERLASVTAHLVGVRSHEARFLLLVAGTIEGLSALAMLASDLTQAGALVASFLWAGYAIALWRRRGERMDCGCDFVRREKPVDMGAIARPLVLVFLALALMVLPSGSWSAEMPFAAIGFAALWFAVGEFLSLPHFARAS